MLFWDHREHQEGRVCSFGAAFLALAVGVGPAGIVFFPASFDGASSPVGLC